MKKKILLPVMVGLLMVLATVGVTYAFFNYTRTGQANTLNTGRIYFSTEQTNNNTINLNNIFPMTKEQALADSSTNGTLVVTFNGDTEYTDGMEYLLSIDSVTGTANVPISLIMDVNITENSVALTENTNYYTAREGKTASMYKAEGKDTVINSTTHKVITDIETGKYLLAGYIKSGEYGVNGTVTIKAFIDADNLLITDTPDDQSQRPSTAYTDGTDTTGKTVISTTDWNNLQTNGITFKVKGEAREGIWVEEQLTRNDMKSFSGTTIFTNEQKSSITEINFIRMSEEETNTHANLIDLTASGGKGVVKGWIDNNKLYIASPGETYFPENSAYLLSSFSNVTNINFNNINTSNVTNMSAMFADCNNLTNIGLTSFDTSIVIDMSNMFYNCGSLITLDLDNFNTSNVTDMSNMFNGCSGLTSIDLSGWGNNNLTSVHTMFQGCTNLTTINMSDFNFGRSNLYSDTPFWKVDNVEIIDLSNANVSQVTDLSNLFINLSHLENVDLTNWDTRNVTAMVAMFSGCSSLVTLDLSSFDTSSLTSPGVPNMFGGCTSLTTIYVSDLWNVSNVPSGMPIFTGCTSLVGGNGTTFDSSKVDKTMAVIDTPSTPGYLTLKTN